MHHDLPSQSFVSCFARVFDAAVIGGGYAGLAAAQRLRGSGWSVLLVERRMALLWESGWAFHDRIGDCDLPGFQRLAGAPAEVEAAVRARSEGWDVLGYATPMAVTVAGGRLVDVAFGTKSGLRRIRARRWLDASDDGELVRLLGATPPPAGVRRLGIHRAKAGGRFDRLALELQPGERVAQGWLRALAGSGAPDGWVVSHGSVVAYPEWDGTAAAPALPDNVALAVPAFAGAPLPTLADRHRLGWQAAGVLLQAPAAEPATGALPAIRAPTHRAVDVAVIGNGTGGALAALAAARSGATVVAVEPLPFAGGIGAGGGIHWYYHGVKGGLQEEVDTRVRELLSAFGGSRQVMGFHPDAKKCAIDALLHQAGVEPVTGTLIEVEREGRTIRSALIATPEGPLRLPAAAWIDGTGDGDLCAAAGCASTFGRVGDGLPHAFSQSSGCVREQDGVAAMTVVNFDQGFVDPTDVEDLSRARLLGIAQYRLPAYTPARPTYIAPAIGLRQARHIATRTTLQLDDLIARRRFPDSVGRTGCHYDNHATDYEFESDEGLFWVWGCRAWSVRTACDIPFGILVPQDLDNAFIASRCLGVSQDAHHSLRMQRDMQRIGEVAGLAAVQVARRGSVDLPALQTALRTSGALAETVAGEAVEAGQPWYAHFGPTPDQAQFAELAADLRAADWGVAGPAMWRAYRAGDRAALLPLLEDGNPLLGWRAAVVLAMLGEAAALPRLWQAIETREWGFGDADQRSPESSNWLGKTVGDARLLPHWRQAISLLRCVGTADDLTRLARAVMHETLHFSLANQLATTVARLALRSPTEAAREAGLKLLERCAGATGGAWRNPQQSPIHIAGPRSSPANDMTPVRDDAAWQLAVAVATARKALGQQHALPAVQDERALVRRAYARLA